MITLGTCVKISVSLSLGHSEPKVNKQPSLIAFINGKKAEEKEKTQCKHY